MRITPKNFCHALLVLLVAGFLPVCFSSCGAGSAPKEAPSTEKKDSVAVVQKRFGIPVDSFEVVTASIQRNEFLSTILQRYHIDGTTAANLAMVSRPVFNVRNMAAGREYTVFCTKDSVQKAAYFVYQPNPIDYVVYDLRDSVRVYMGKRKVTTEEKTSSGVITSSLYETLAETDTDPALAMKLANIYAWAVDFYAIKKGDWFKVIYEQRYVQGEPIEAGQIKAAVFSHDGEDFYAFYFQPDSTDAGEYYDEAGKSLRKAFLKAPLKFSRITSRYTLRRFHPVQKRWKAHLGTDYAAATGTPIISTGNGVVIESRYTKFNGNYVKIRHNSTYTTQYLHMSKRAVKVGQHVMQGQVIGYVGSTGLATGPHVCYRFWKNGKQVDALKQHFPPAEPIKKDAMPAFEQWVKVNEHALNDIRVDTARRG